MTDCIKCRNLLARIGAMGLGRDEVMDDAEFEAEHRKHQRGGA